MPDGNKAQARHVLWYNHDMEKISVVLLISVLTATAVSADRLPDGWLAAVNSNAAIQASRDYANNIIRCVWAGDKPGIASAIPANTAFQFVIAGHEQSVSNIQAVLDETAEAIPSNILSAVRRFHLLAPTLQRIVRLAKCKKPNRADYLWSSTHPAAFAESDFNLSNLLAVARNLSAAEIPPAAVIRLESEETVSRQPLVPAIPGVDYPDSRPEITFATPFGIGMVVRAPESTRVLRFRATAFPASRVPVTFSWAALTGGARVQSWNGGRQAKDGYGRILLDVNALCAKKRVDVAVFARWGNGPWSAPSIISFYISPYEKRTYRKDELVSIQYLPKTKVPPPYDISAICTPAEWTDVYQHDEKNQITGFSRLLPDAVTGEEFSDRNERIIETQPNGTPKIAERISYFIRDGQLRYEGTGEQISYRLETFRPRRFAK